MTPIDSPRIRLTSSPLDIGEAFRCVAGSGMGGVALFIGTVRGVEEGRPIGGIGYEAYEGMALKELDACARGAEERHGAKVAVFHRVGTVPVGEASVVVAASAPHRAEAFAACREAIESIKESVPIWKSSFIEAAD
ncbi:MAG: molybdenum cofactor biosynthesis protein MoaE [Elusimicrobiota bacterium]